MGPDVIIYSGSHRFKEKNKTVHDQGYISIQRPVIILDDVFAE